MQYYALNALHLRSIAKAFRVSIGVAYGEARPNKLRLSREQTISGTFLGDSDSFQKFFINNSSYLMVISGISGISGKDRKRDPHEHSTYAGRRNAAQGIHRAPVPMEASYRASFPEIPEIPEMGTKSLFLLMSVFCALSTVFQKSADRFPEMGSSNDAEIASDTHTIG
ncbi:hypothetical protein EN814_09780 [Mesorhizobium sp. M2D.F.Ca.ET.171.01.1.1]|uniref:hypothetical protein n=1 Tax=unclassified Mesorhizobium TaxID=325217 RepID=UPI001092C37A|nr:MULTISPECIES: hypothetical protein [unclassified Mesorhizobium]TGS97473.1 hypothetical protein EN821_09775 [Mesorhizobium sp. M2D.F.Ca.ET.178.01.1.1]TGT12044.1 hypothetical protein EN814_09780 [Mesorhizobium sp. M2D.F.Ca.ET.171.01.1.1]